MALIEEDSWEPIADGNVILHDNLDHYTLHHEITMGKFRNQYVREHRGGKLAVWSSKQTRCLYAQLITKRIYNLRKVQEQKCLSCFNIIEIHDRAIILLLLHRMKVFNDGVAYLHCWESKTMDISLPTWLDLTSEYLEHYYIYHGFHEDDEDRLPQDLWYQGRLKVMRAYKIMHEYLNFYSTLEGSFDRIYSDLTILNFDVTEDKDEKELPLELFKNF